MELIFLIFFVNSLIYASAAPQAVPKAPAPPSAHKLPFTLTEAEIKHYYGTSNISNVNYAVALVDDIIFGGRSKRSVPNNLNIPLTYWNGTRFVANLTLTDGILADINTTIWKATGKSDSEDVRYTKDCEAMAKLGPISFYQDLEHKAALMLVHKTKLLHGFVFDAEFKLRHLGPNPQESKGKQYVLIPLQLQPGHTQHIQSDNNTYSEVITPPEKVYPQILVSLDWTYVQVGETEAIRQILTYWNAVDMLYSAIRYPRISFRINGIIIPQNEYATPWIDKNRYSDKPHLFNGYTAYDQLGNHFQKSTVFHDDDYDIMASFTVNRMGPKGSVLGLAHLGCSCNAKNNRVALISTNFVSHTVAAHEFGHLFGVSHEHQMGCKNDTNTMMGAYYGTGESHYQWSRCAQLRFSSYFSSSKAHCYLNNPLPKEVCKVTPLVTSGKKP